MNVKSQSQKVLYCMIPCIEYSRNEKNHRNGDQISDYLGCRGPWEWEQVDVSLKGQQEGALW